MVAHLPSTIFHDPSLISALLNETKSMKWIIIGTGGFVGSILRYVVSGWAGQFGGSYSLPIGTITVNVLGSLLIGLLFGLSDLRGWFSPELRLLIFVGFLGGFTTFSTFSLDTLHYLRDGQWWQGLSHVILHLFLCISAVVGGFLLSKTLV